MSTKLLPCPFCGGEAEILNFDPPDFDEDHENFGGSCVVCKKCQANTAVVFGYKETLHSSWNERLLAYSPDGWVMVPVPINPDLRAAIIEECAKVAEADTSFMMLQDFGLQQTCTQVRTNIAEAIRALSASPLTDENLDDER